MRRRRAAGAGSGHNGQARRMRTGVCEEQHEKDGGQSAPTRCNRGRVLDGIGGDVGDICCLWVVIGQYRMFFEHAVAYGVPHYASQNVRVGDPAPKTSQGGARNGGSCDITVSSQGLPTCGPQTGLPRSQRVGYEAINHVNSGTDVEAADETSDDTTATCCRENAPFVTFLSNLSGRMEAGHCLCLRLTDDRDGDRSGFTCLIRSCGRSRMLLIIVRIPPSTRKSRGGQKRRCKAMIGQAVRAVHCAAATRRAASGGWRWSWFAANKPVARSLSRMIVHGRVHRDSRQEWLNCGEWNLMQISWQASATKGCGGRPQQRPHEGQWGCIALSPEGGSNDVALQENIASRSTMTVHAVGVGRLSTPNLETAAIHEARRMLDDN
ncbi:hypothetical protein K461DRAFT_266974 [Myriangium duriaei CBS 260.36]|uniref:Uncharacterized protein n=1 Tax=Myriangium duriaei CBS 260.36 TaxID=1168546 RepID=A0A9P4J5K1_9PEZI|nr:hypothetical protein K461DRAFT_266974 [Myriangium duriaei CBS 260.36]